jgi:hypothetical protein
MNFFPADQIKHLYLHNINILHNKTYSLQQFVVFINYYKQNN